MRMCDLEEARGLCASPVPPKFKVDMLGLLGTEAVRRDEMSQHQLMHVIPNIEYTA